jgi:hypothetical protein
MSLAPVSRSISFEAHVDFDMALFVTTSNLAPMIFFGHPHAAHALIKHASAKGFYFVDLYVMAAFLK